MNNNQHIHIIGGTGQMGSWTAKLLAKHGYRVTVSGKHKKDSKSIEECDALLISIPLHEAPGIISKALYVIKPTTTIIDFSSLMSLVEPVFQSSRNPVASIHFLFGPTTTSLQSQHIITNIIRSSQFITQIIELFEQEGALTHCMTSKEHDITMAHIQALTQISNLSLTKTVCDNGIGLLPSFSTPTFTSQSNIMLRVLNNNSTELLTNLQLYNPYFPNILKQHIKTQQELLDMLIRKQEVLLRNTYEAIRTQVVLSEQAAQAENIKIDHVKRELDIL